MRAIMIDPQTQNVDVIQHSGNLKDIYKLIGNDCSDIEIPFVLENGDSFYCDKEALYHENIGGVFHDDWNNPLVGRILVLNVDWTTGASRSAKSTVEDIKNNFNLHGPNSFIIENWFKQFQ